MTTIVLVDDESNILKALQRILSRQPWEILTFTNPAQALEELVATPVDLIVSDYRMPEMNGVEFLSEFRETHTDTIRLILSGQADMGGLMSAINNAEVYRFITKPWNNDELILTLQQALQFNQLRIENEHLAQTVRNQSRELNMQLSELRRLEKESPGITQVDWNDDGSINFEGCEDYLDQDILDSN